MSCGRDCGDAQAVVGALAAHSLSRCWLNSFYLALPLNLKMKLYNIAARLFAAGRPLEADGLWIIRFAGMSLLLPLTTRGAWQEWDAAVSILGHDIEVKTTYANLLRSTRRPKLFFDVGANYGLHSLSRMECKPSLLSRTPNVTNTCGAFVN